VKAVVSNEQFYRIANGVAGDALLAIRMLRSAGNKTDRQVHDRITDNILLDATEDVQPISARRVSVRPLRING
jgi:hypothetical protein